MDELLEFSLLVFGKLRSREDATKHYESLEVGARLDVAISDTSVSGCWFVGEVTRFTGADQFPIYNTPYPHTQIADAFSTALRNYILYGGGNRGAKVR